MVSFLWAYLLVCYPLVWANQCAALHQWCLWHLLLMCPILLWAVWPFNAAQSSEFPSLVKLCWLPLPQEAVWQGNGSHWFSHWPVWCWLSVPPDPKSHLVWAICNFACSPLAMASPDLHLLDHANWGFNGLHLKPALNWSTQHTTRLLAIHLQVPHYIPTH